MKKSLLLASLLAFGTSSFAGDWYVGFGAGQSNIDSGVTTSGGTVEEGDTSWKIYTGYKVNKYFAVEGFYADLGEIISVKGNNGDTFTLSGTTYAMTADSASVNVDATTIGFAGIATYPLHKNFEPFVKLGLHRYDLTASATAAGIGSATSSETGTDLLYGLGFNAPITDNIAIRAEYEVISADSYDDASIATIGLNYKF